MPQRKIREKRNLEKEKSRFVFILYRLNIICFYNIFGWNQRKNELQMSL